MTIQIYTLGRISRLLTLSPTRERLLNLPPKSLASTRLFPPWGEHRHPRSILGKEVQFRSTGELYLANGRSGFPEFALAMIRS